MRRTPTSSDSICLHQVLHRLLFCRVNHILIIVFIDGDFTLLGRATFAFFMDFTANHLVGRSLLIYSRFVLDRASCNRPKLLKRLLRLVLVKFHLVGNLGIGSDLRLLDRNVHRLRRVPIRFNREPLLDLVELLASQGSLQLGNAGWLRSSNDLRHSAIRLLLLVGPGD